MIVEEGEYKGSKTLTFKEDETDRFLFSFGYAKAKIMVENIEAIKDFVTKCEAEKVKNN